MFELDIKTGLIKSTRYMPSPNHDDRPLNTVIDLIVIHGISLPPGQFDGDAVIEFFQNELDINAHPYFAEIKDLKVSSHLLIRRDGQVVQFVPLHKRAWHAGLSNFDGRSGCNDFSIGIELEGVDDIPYTPIQYVVLADLCITMKQHYARINKDHIVGHSDIAPGRKTDPGAAFEWDFFKNLLDERAI